MKDTVIRFLRDEDGATMVEYAILVALISIVAIATIALVGDEVNSAFSTVQSELNAANA